MKVIYIMGLGRSGSTLLDVVLGNHPQMYTVGQFADFVRIGWIHSTTCSCGQTATECPFWSAVRRRWHARLGDHSEREYEAARQMHERMSRSPYSLPASRLGTKRYRFYINSTVALYRSVFEVCEGKVIVDSSKMPFRGFHLSRAEGIDLRIIHIVRDARAVAYSWSKPARSTPRDPKWTAVNWMATHLASEWVLRNIDDSASLRLRYEDFVEDPANTLRLVGDLVNEDMNPVISRLLENQPMTITHLASGNQLRLEQQIRLKPDREWQTAMRKEDQRSVWAITFPLMVKYKYSRKVGRLR